MMESQVDRELLEKIADLIGKPVGAFNIRKDTGRDGLRSPRRTSRSPARPTANPALTSASS